MSDLNNNQNSDNDNDRNRMRDRFSRKPGMPRSPSGFFWVYIILVLGLIAFFLPGMFNEIPEINSKEYAALVRDRAIKQMYVITNNDNRIELQLDLTKDKAPAILEIKKRIPKWRGPNANQVTHLRLNNSWTEEFNKQLIAIQTQNGYTDADYIPLKQD
ncbi:MAG: hypothetical protein ACRC3B_07450, partial [Bacteroidia bacterium]